MTKSYTRIHFDISECKAREEEGSFDHVPEISTPSDSVIKNLLNYSKALSVSSDSTGNMHLVLLN